MKKQKSLTHKEIEYLKEFGHRIRLARLGRGWTLEQVEERGWSSWQHLQQIEAGKKNINLTTLIRLLRIFKIDPKDIIGNLDV